MDKSTCKVFHARLDSMLSGLLAEFNNEMSRSRITYSDTGLKITIETVEKNTDGSLKIDDFANAKIHDALWCYYRDVPKVVIGLKWRDEKGNTWRILDWNNRARTYPIVCKNQNGESSRWAVAYVASRLQVALVA